MVVVLFSLLILNGASAANPMNTHTITKTSLVSTTTHGVRSNPDMYGNKMVWQEWNPNTKNNDIYMYDKQTNTITPLSNSSELEEFQPRIYGNRIVWTDCTPYDPNKVGVSGIEFYDITTHDERTLAMGDTIPNDPSIYNDTVVWSDGIITDYIYLWRVGDSKSNILAKGTEPDIWGKKIVYCSNRNNQKGIYLSDLGVDTGSEYVYEKCLYQSSGNVYNPKIYGNIVVWEDITNNNPEIYMYDISKGGTAVCLTQNLQGEHSDPTIWGTRIAWTGKVNGNSDNYIYNLQTKSITHSNTPTINEEDPSLYGNVLLYSDGYDIQTLTFDVTPPSVTNIDPVNYALKVPCTKTITITFSEPIKAGSNYSLITVKNSAGSVVPIIKSISGKVLTIKRSSGTYSNLMYTISLPANCITDLAGNGLKTGYISKFTVDSIPPKVSSTSPTNLKTGVSRTPTLTIYFNEYIKSSTNYGAITLKNLSTGTCKTISKSISSNKLFIKSTTKLYANTWYQVTIPAKAVKDYAYNNLQTSYSFKFKTGIV